MTNELVNPNLHAALVHVPIGLLFVGVLIEVFSFLGWRRSALRVAGRYMILIGALSAIPTALAGVYALADVVRMGMDPSTASDQWKTVLENSPVARDGAAWHLLRDHVLWSAVGTTVVVFACIVWLGGSDRWRDRLHIPLLVILLMGTAMLGAAARHGGESVYERGVGVGRVFDPNFLSASEYQARLGTAPSAATSAGTVATTGPTTNDSRDARVASAEPATHSGADATTGSRDTTRGFAYFLPPMQAHVISAGIVVALAMLAIGLAWRQAVQPLRAVAGDQLAAALGGGTIAAHRDALPDDDDSFLPAEQRMVMASRTGGGLSVPPARFWMLSVLFALITAALGVVVLTGSDWSMWLKPRELWELIAYRDESTVAPFGLLTRRFSHVLAGGAIVVLSLILAMLGRWAPRQKFLLFIFTLLVLAVIASQVWVGVLLLLDTDAGSILRFS